MICLGKKKVFLFWSQRSPENDQQATIFSFLRFKSVIFDKTRFATALMENVYYFVQFHQNMIHSS